MEDVRFFNDTLYHHGIKGQKWGLRRFQNEDGSLTAAGRDRYGYGKKAYSRKEWKQVKKDMRAKRDSLNENYMQKNKETADKLSNNLTRKRELYEKEKERNSFLLDNPFNSPTGPSSLAKAMYESNIKRSRNAYEKAQKEYEAFEKAGEEYVSSRMQKQFGKDYSDWQQEIRVARGVAAGAALVSTVALYTYPFWAFKHSTELLGEKNDNIL